MLRIEFSKVLLSSSAVLVSSVMCFGCGGGDDVDPVDTSSTSGAASTTSTDTTATDTTATDTSTDTTSTDTSTDTTATDAGSCDEATTPAEPACTNKVTAGDSPMIANFDDYTASTLEPEGGSGLPTPGAFAGGTYAYHNVCAAEDPDATRATTLGMGPDDSQAYELTITNTVTWGGGMGFWLIDGCVDASAYSGISLSLRGSSPSGEAEIAFRTVDTAAVVDGGNCPDDGTCVAPTYIAELSDEWTDLTILWEDFTPGDANGTEEIPNGDNFIGLNINLGTGDAYGMSSNIEFAIDNVQFVE